MTKARPGPRNLITDVPGLAVGQAQDEAVRTGVTVILPDERAVCAVDVRGGGPGTRETDALSPETLVEAIDAVVLSGGSMYGLGAADGVAAWLGAQGRGYGLNRAPGVPRSPIVPAAILYDLANGGEKAWGLEPPYRRLGLEAIGSAGLDFALGTAGAGYGARAGQLKGGLGCAGLPIGADDWGLAKINPGARENTTIACVATDVALTPAQAKRIAIMAQAGMAQSIRPVHAPFDGDVVFALSTGRQPLGDGGDQLVARIGALVADCLARAVARGVYEARSLPDGPRDWRSLPKVDTP